MLKKLITQSPDETQEQEQEIDKQWATVFQLSNASTEQLALYRTQTLTKLNDNLARIVKLLKAIKKLLIAALLCLVIIALFV